MTDKEFLQKQINAMNTFQSSLIGGLASLLLNKGVITPNELQELYETAAKDTEDVTGTDLLDIVTKRFDEFS